LASDNISEVICIVRKPLKISHEKLKVIVHDDFLNYQSINETFQHIDIAYFCIGVYTGALPDAQFKEITVDYTKAFADTLKNESPKATFCFLSGQGADLKLLLQNIKAWLKTI
jgi:putative NADH-flavin reductase